MCETTERTDGDRRLTTTSRYDQSRLPLVPMCTTYDSAC